MQIFANGNSIFIFHGILCDTPKKSRGKNLIMVTTLKFWVLVLNYKFPNLFVFLWLCDLFELVRSSKMFLGHRIGSRI